MPEILISNDQMVRAFVRWERLYRENPRAFVSTVENLLAGRTALTVGAECAEYFTSLLVDVK
jgi:hypothetical protein